MMFMREDGQMGTCRICGKNFGLIGGYMEEFTGERLNVCVDCIKKFRQISEEDSSMVRTIVDDLISSCNNEKTLPRSSQYHSFTNPLICLVFVFKRSTLNYYRLYSRARKLCKDCPRLSICEIDQGAIRINASGNYPAFHRNKLKYHTPEYVKVMRLRKIWAEGTFSVLKREHNLKRIHKRGIIRAEEECLFSAMALNLKRLVKAM